MIFFWIDILVLVLFCYFVSFFPHGSQLIHKIISTAPPVPVIVTCYAPTWYWLNPHLTLYYFVPPTTPHALITTIFRHGYKIENYSPRGEKDWWELVRSQMEVLRCVLIILPVLVFLSQCGNTTSQYSYLYTSTTLTVLILMLYDMATGLPPLVPLLPLPHKLSPRPLNPAAVTTTITITGHKHVCTLCV